MKSERRVRLIAASREVRVSAESGSEVLRYPGISVVRVGDGQPTEETWVPLGASPSFADDETVIAALRAAVQWRLACA
ncbi:hypothetical protein [Amycolatopsis sp. NPDC051061]|uniref:hypothetical protein n=1 Tax=Amycolatopsis sp. NPDC051061 TaxID=3155042 RepID=UPI00341C2DE6